MWPFTDCVIINILILGQLLQAIYDDLVSDGRVLDITGWSPSTLAPVLNEFSRC